MSVTFCGDSRESPSLNLCNSNAIALLGALGLEAFGKDGLVGSISVPDARRAVMRARALPEFLRPFTREHREEIGPRGARFIYYGLSFEQLVDQVERFAAVVEQAAAVGSKEIVWA